MKISVILAHPDKKSFNHAIAAAIVETLKMNSHMVFYHDLYEEEFDPILRSHEIPKEAELSREIGTYCDELIQSDGVVIVHPNWWGQPPAILKGWVDRVIRPGVAYQFLEGDNGEGIPEGLLKGKKALVFNTSNTPEERERNVFGDPLETLWRDCVFDLCGVKTFYRRMFKVIVTSSEEERKGWLREAMQTVNEYFPGGDVRINTANSSESLNDVVELGAKG